ncbi:MAG: O-antigen ligase family protein [Candidatus Phosphoribacter sp.]|nr:O-antigen ligase family protein [Actinomycetales bacterium]
MPAGSPHQGGSIGLYVVWILLLAATLPWRAGVFFDGAIDSVVVSKALISLVALTTAVLVAGAGRQALEVPASPLIVLASYLAVTIIGGYAHGTLMAAAIVAVRVAILVATIALLTARWTPYQVMRALVHVMAVLVVAATISGLPTIASGRLRGAVPPMNPNELALLASVCFLWIFAKMLRARETPVELLAAGGFAGITLLTGSRAGLAALCVAIVFMALRAIALTPRSFAAVMMLGPVFAYIAFGTDLIASVFLRGGERSVTTLNSRTIAWNAALTSDRDPWETWFGAGLAQKKIEVPGQWWTSQLLDSSWISALVQGGLIGLALVAVLVATTIMQSLALNKASAALWLGLTAYLATRGLLESALFDSSVSFMVLVTALLGARMNVTTSEHTTRHPPEAARFDSGNARESTSTISFR